MTPLQGHIVLALGDMAERPLARYLRSLGATIVEDYEVLGTTSFLIDDLGLELLSDRGLTREKIETENPALIHVSVTPFGSGGPRSRWRGGELVSSAMGGTLRLTGSPDRAPVKEALDACTFHADMVAGAGAMAAHYARGTNGLGQHVDVSIQKLRSAGTSTACLFGSSIAASCIGSVVHSTTARPRFAAIWRLADGWCFHSLMTGRFGAPANQALSDWMDERQVRNPLKGVNWLTYNRSTLPIQRHGRIGRTRSVRFSRSARRPKWRAKGAKRGINACVVAEPADVLADEHLKMRRFWTAGNIKEPSRFALLREGPKANNRTEGKTVRGRPAFWRSRARLLLGAGRLDHHEDAGRPGCRRCQDREPHPTMTCRAWTCRSRRPGPAIWTTSRGSRISTVRSGAWLST